MSCFINGEKWIGAWHRPELEGQSNWKVIELISTSHSGLDQVQDWEVIIEDNDYVLVAILA